MREILFKGKRVDNGEWVFGYIVHSIQFDGWFIDSTLKGKDISYEVLPETVSQYTGFYDSNNNKIFEGDKLRYDDIVKVVEYSSRNANYILRFEKGGGFVDTLSYFIERKCKIIGNIHDN